ncbi:hypothetical protein B0H13DRAFT_2533164 [Mycena leptocephala]|nr:hypothetical protein B0H13DRAFT_2533164 [Mycena leptocephala]
MASTSSSPASPANRLSDAIHGRLGGSGAIMLTRMYPAPRHLHLHGGLPSVSLVGIFGFNQSQTDCIALGTAGLPSWWSVEGGRIEPRKVVLVCQDNTAFFVQWLHPCCSRVYATWAASYRFSRVPPHPSLGGPPPAHNFGGALESIRLRAVVLCRGMLRIAPYSIASSCSVADSLQRRVAPAEVNDHLYDTEDGNHGIWRRYTRILHPSTRAYFARRHHSTSEYIRGCVASRACICGDSGISTGILIRNHGASTLPLPRPHCLVGIW